jgi:hypothetical protein
MQVCQCCTSTSKSNKKKLRKSLSSAPLVSSAIDSSTSYRRFDDSASDTSSGSSFSKSPSPEKKGEPEGSEGDGEEGEEDGELPYHTIVIDCAPIGFADSMGVTVLEQVRHKHSAFVEDSVACGYIHVTVAFSICPQI